MKFIATIEEDEDLQKIVEHLQKQGYTITRVRNISRNISGNTEKKTIKDLKTEKGIKSAEEQRNIYKA
jgi:hypothetical protein